MEINKEQEQLLSKIKEVTNETTKRIADEFNIKIKDIETKSAKFEDANKNVEAIDSKINTIIKEHNDITLELKSLSEKFNSKQVEKIDFKQELGIFFKENIDKIKEIRRGGHGSLNINLKAAAPMIAGSATSPDGIPTIAGVQMAPPSNVSLKTSFIESLVTNLTTGLASYPYTESVPKDGDYSFIAEKGTKPLTDFKIETRYATPVKVAAHIELSEESVTDIPSLQSIAENLLLNKHNLKKQSGILNGDGSNNTPKGALAYGRAFSNANLAAKIVKPNFMDYVNACITDIYMTHNYTDEIPFMPNIVLVNPYDFFINMVAAKDSRGLSLYPAASLFNRLSVGGVTILPVEEITAGKLFVADLSKYNITNYVPYSMRIAWINDQAITNQFCIIGESRFHAFVKKLDEKAFIYDTIANIDTAIKQ